MDDKADRAHIALSADLVKLSFFCALQKQESDEVK